MRRQGKSIKPAFPNAMGLYIDGLGVHYVKRNKSERERQILYDITYMQNLNYDPNSSTKQEQTHRQENRLVVAEGQGGRGRVD